MSLNRLMDLTGQVAVVTGGCGYLGSVMSETLAELGANVYAVSRGLSKSFLGGGIRVIESDLSSEQNVIQLVDTILNEQGRIDVLVNNSYTWPTIVDYSKATWRSMAETLDAGLISQLYMTKLVMMKMIETKVPGRIINVCSMYGKVSPDISMYRGIGGNAIEYGASKAGLIQATKYMASYGGKHGIRVNSISPGPFPRPGAFDGKEWFEDELKRRTMLCRVGASIELKGVIAFLATDMSSYVTGADVAVDGGWTSM